MTSAIFKSTGAIIIYSILSIGLLAIAGYNFWGWFGGSDKWKASHHDNSGTSGGKTGGRSSSESSSTKIKPEVYDLLPNYNTARATQSQPNLRVCSDKTFMQYFTSNHNDDNTNIKYNIVWHGSDCNDPKLLQAIDITDKYMNSIETACNRPSNVVAELVARIQNVVKLPINFKGQITVYCNPCFNGLGAKLFCD